MKNLTTNPPPPTRRLLLRERHPRLINTQWCLTISVGGPAWDRQVQAGLTSRLFGG